LCSLILFSSNVLSHFIIVSCYFSLFDTEILNYCCSKSIMLCIYVTKSFFNIFYIK